MGLFKSKKCQAKVKELCVDPQCPEKMYLKNAYDRAIKNKDFETFFQIKEEEKRLEPLYVNKARTAEDWDRLVVKDITTQQVLSTPITPFVKQTYDRNIHIIERFDHFADIQETFWENKNIKLTLGNADQSHDGDLVHGFYVGNFYVSPALRGQGVGEYIMKTLTTHADDTGSMIELVPTSAGDGRLSEENDGWRDAALAHRNRLTKFYERHGFVKNPFFKPSGGKDYITGEEWSYDHELAATFTKQGLKIMQTHLEYIRWPNNTVPKGILKPVKKVSSTQQ